MDADVRKTPAHDLKYRHHQEFSGAPWWLPSLTGIFLGLLFFILTHTPSLVPRPTLFQGLLGGLAFFTWYRLLHSACAGQGEQRE